MTQAQFWWDEADDAEELIREAEAADRADREHEARLDEAAADIQRANAAYDQARLRVLGAPHGETNRRRADVRLANQRVLAAELRYAEIRRERPD